MALTAFGLSLDEIENHLNRKAGQNELRPHQIVDPMPCQSIDFSLPCVTAHKAIAEHMNHGTDDVQPGAMAGRN